MRFIIAALVLFAMAWKKHLKSQKDNVDSSDDNFNKRLDGNNRDHGNEEDDDDNHISFMADGSIVVSKMAHVVN